MKSIEAFLSALSRLQIKIWLEGDQLGFKAPKGALTPELRSELKQRKPEIITYLKDLPQPQTTISSIQPVPRHQDLPLSFAQQRLWFLAQLENEQTPYNESSGLNIWGPLRVHMLEQALTSLTERHEILRTTFAPGPLQVIGPVQPIRIPVVDLRALSESEQSQQVQSHFQEENQQAFDLEAGPLWRVKLLQLTDRYVLLLTLHHIIFDMWSMGIFIRELSLLYPAYLRSEPSPLPPLPIQYADYAVWQRQQLTGSVLQKQLDYWKDQLSGLPPLLELPTDHPRPPIQTFHGGIEPFCWDREFTAQLKAFGRQSDATLFMVLLTGFSLVLSRYSGQLDIAIGSPIANRTHPQTEALIGFFANTLVFRLALSDNPSLEQLVQQAKRVALAAYSHQDVPFEQVVEELQPERSLSYTPLFQVMLVLQNAPRSQLNLADLSTAPLAQDSGIAKFDLTLSFTEVDQQLEGHIEYNRDLFEPLTIQGMIQHLGHLLEYLMAHPTQAVQDVNWMTKQEPLPPPLWNALPAHLPHETTIVEWFEAQVERTPHQTAVVFEGTSLSYRALNEQANQWASLLRSRGVQPDTLVGICVEPSISMVVGLLGILKAGGAYLPIDPDYPESRITFLLKDSQVSMVLTQTHLWKRLPQSSVVLLDLESEIPESQNSTNLTLQHTPKHLAYAIYTSGTTGTAKGVMIEHASLSNHMHWMLQTFELGEQDIILQKTPFTFDASVWEFWAPLLSGGTLCMTKPGGHRDPEYLIETIQQQQVTVLQVVPSLLNLLLAHRNFLKNTPLRLLFCGGEALPQSAVQSVFQSQAPLQLINLYGPSETTIDATFWHCTNTTAPISLGQPIANVQVHVLDDQLQPVPTGIPGELCISGAGLARGYLNRPERTAEKFVKIEIEGHPTRIYKTGDRARRRSDGTLQFLGRVDTQIKLRGFRIEPGEIESTLCQHDQVREAVVIVSQETNPRLIAYVTLQSPLDGANEVLDRWTKQQVPSYMIPARYIVLDQFIYTPHGKIDRQALPKPEMPHSNTPFAAPRNEVERQLVACWSQVLQQTDIGIFDNFFERGGDSILSIQIVSQARANGLHLNPRDVFQHQTIAELAVMTARANKPRPYSGAAPANPSEPVTGLARLTPIQQAFFHRSLPEPHHFNQALLFTVPQDISATALHAALGMLMQHHDGFRLRFCRTAPGWEQHYEAPFEGSNSSQPGPFHQENLTHLSQDEALRVLKERINFWQTSLNLESGPLTRLVLFQIPQGARLFWCIHHLIVDGVSWRILLEDLRNCYTHYRKHSSSTLKRMEAFQLRKTSSVQAFTDHLEAWTNRESFQTDADYWRHLPALPSLPQDDPNGRNLIEQTRHYTIHLSQETTRTLLKEAPSAFRTHINDLLLTALAATLRDWTGRSQHLIDVESHGRTDLFPDLDLSRTVGWFTALYTVSLTLPEAPNDWAAAIKSVKEQLRQVPHDGIGYGVLRFLKNEALPQSQILFNYLGQFDSTLEDSEWRVAPEGSGHSRSPHEQRDYGIEVNGQVSRGCLNLVWSYSSEQYQDRTIHDLARYFQNTLLQLLQCCRTTYGVTPSDFPLATLTQPQLDQLVQQSGNTIADLYPLSPMQEGMLFHSLNAPKSGVYMEQFHFRVIGSLNWDKFQSAWRILVERHSALRTAFESHTPSPTQVVYKTVEIPWEFLDWRDLPASEHPGQLERLLTEARTQGFELNRAPLMRLQVIRETETQSRLVWHHHHLLMDGWGLPILFGELTEIYQAVLQGTPPQLPPVAAYRDYIAWILQQDQQAAQNYWQQRLQGFFAPTPIPLPPVGKGSSDFREVSLSIDSEWTKQLTAAGRKHRLTLNTLVQGAWSALLSRYSGETDVVFGVTSSGREVPVPGVDRMLGVFINTLPLRVDWVSQDLWSVLEQIQECQQNNQQFAYAALADIQKWSEVPNGVPLFESIVVFENYPMDERIQSGETAQTLSLADLHAIETTNYPLTLTVFPGQQLHFKMTYDAYRFHQEHVKAMLRHLQRLLEGMAQTPTPNWEQLALVTESEMQPFFAPHSNGVPFPPTKTVVDLFEKSVEHHSLSERAASDESKEISEAQTAVVFQNERMTYAELNQQANQMAHYLMSLGVGPDTLVGICVDRSPLMMIGLLGILKAGGAYVPLDPDYPHSRLQFMVENSQLSLLLSQTHLVDRLPPTTTRVVNLEQEGEQIAKQSYENPPRHSGPKDLAYVIYTSGSTGQPKGVMIEHQALANFLLDMQSRLAFTPDDHLLAVTTLSFDIAALELYLPLISGAQVTLVDRHTASDGKRLIDTLSEVPITVMQATPTTWKLLLQSGWQQSRPLKIVCGGEALSPDLGAALLQQSQQLWNVYGPTETTIWSSAHDITRHPGRPELIGAPLSNTQIVLLDSQHRWVPAGVPGELCIGGAGLARGYLHRPELTAERFIEREHSGQTHRLYKTGDLARWLPGATLEYLGRLDHQIKLRGFRIETGEIESAIKQHTAVQDAAVVLVEQTDLPYLAAFVLSHNPSFFHQRIEHWEAIWQEAYQPSVLPSSANSTGDYTSGAQEPSATFNTQGWINSYTHQPIPVHEMQEWLEGSVQRILKWQPKHVLEIGCGTGMILYRVAPHCQTYLGTDLVNAVLNRIETQISSPHVRLEQRPAHDFSGIVPGDFDMVILNSVIQYFPNLSYLEQVLEGAIHCVASGGTIFIGDVRHYALLDHFHADTQWDRAPDSLSGAQFVQTLQDRGRDEKELLVDPDFFRSLPQQDPRVSQVDVQLKRGIHHNEMSNFRYDVTLHIEPEACECQISKDAILWTEWNHAEWSLERVRSILVSHEDQPLGFSQVPNTRTTRAVAILEWLSRPLSRNQPVSTLKNRFPNSASPGVDPEAWETLAQDFGYQGYLTWSAETEPTGQYDVILYRGNPPRWSTTQPPLLDESKTKRYANNPLQGEWHTQLLQELREELKTALPDYMIPTKILFPEALPLTPNRKVDRILLMKWAEASSPSVMAKKGQSYVAPRNLRELQLVQIWERLLDVQPIGIGEDFFELGGHSLLAVRLMAHIEQTMGQPLPLASLAEHRTIEQLAASLNQQRSARSWSSLVPLKTEGTRPPLFGIHPGGGNVLGYFPLSQQLGSDQPFYGLQAQGLEANQTPLTRLEDMADLYLKAITERFPEGPYQLLGWSFGGLVAFEMACRLQAQGHTVSFLGLLDCMTPDLIRKHATTTDNAELLVALFANKFLLDLGHLRSLTSEAQLAYVVEQGKAAHHFPPDVDVDQAQRLLRVFQRNGHAARHYHPASFAGTLHLFQAQDQPEGVRLPEGFGWKRFARNGVKTHTVPGNHQTMITPPHVSILGEQIRDAAGSLLHG